ncbi:MAG: hypothetical protein Q8O67_19555 [Deltaproteobacteria bacterium]|nr:hypothetical protein [Deltaproteobacteria bacterium]
MNALFLMLALVASSTSLAGEIAALPVDSPGLLPGVRESLDVQLRAALLEAGYVVQDAEKTKRFVKDAVDAGLSCSLSDDDCALKAGIAAGVDAVVVVRAVTVDDKLVVELRSVSVEGLPTVGAAGLGDSPGNLARLARRLKSPHEAGAATALPVSVGVEPRDVLISVDGRLLERQPVAKGGAPESATQAQRDTRTRVFWLEPGPHLLQISAEGFDARSVAVDVKGDRLPPPVSVALEKSFPLLVGVGIGAGVGGGVLALVCITGVGLVEAVLAQPQEPSARAGMTTFGRVLVGGAVVGVVAAGTGTALAVAGAVE